MNRKIMSLGLGLVLAGGMVAVPMAASAHTPAASATCEALDINATYYETQPSSGAATIEVTNPDYKAATPGSPAVGSPTKTVPNPDYISPKPAVTKTEYKYLQLVTGKEKWLDSLTWNPGLGWYYSGESKVTEVSPAVLEQGTKTIEVANPDYVAEVPGTPEQGTPTIWVDNPEYVPANDSPNSVTASIDGVEVLNENFGTNFADTIAFENKYIAHDWSVTITAWNDPTGSRGWTKTISGTTTPCDLPIVPANPNASIEGVCGEATITLTNPQGEWEQNKTASFIVEVDGEFDNAYAVTGNGIETITLTFDEDSGDHLIEVFQAGDSEYKSIAEATITTDCEVPPVTPEEPEEPTTPTTPTTPVVDQPTPTQVIQPAVTKAAVADILAETGLNPIAQIWMLTGGAMAVALGALAVLLNARRRQLKADAE